MFLYRIDTNKYTIYNVVGKRIGVVIMKNETIKNVAGIILFYLLIIFGVIAINYRLETLPESSNIAILGN